MWELCIPLYATRARHLFIARSVVPNAPEGTDGSVENVTPMFAVTTMSKA
jgi:hypothetical protein